VEVSVPHRWIGHGFHILSGYSFKSSQYGLAIDNIVGYELVLPNGTIINVTPKDSDLWFGLRVSRVVDTDWYR
jgi:hypothetical protein